MFSCVTRDDFDDSFKAHGPFDTEEAAWAFDQAVDFCCPMDLVSLGAFRASDEDAAIEAAQSNTKAEAE